MNKILLFTCALASSLTLLGCASGEAQKQAFEPHISREGLDPLLDTPLRTQTVCKGVTLFTAGQKLGGFSFECPDLDVTATLNELRDAGWRVEKMHIGKLQIGYTDSEVSGTPLTITLRKVY